jgi:sorbitol-specific phosphotransferase system component IIC
MRTGAHAPTQTHTCAQHFPHVNPQMLFDYVMISSPAGLLPQSYNIYVAQCDSIQHNVAAWQYTLLHTAYLHNISNISVP